MQQIEIYIRKFKSIILILLSTLILFGVIISRVVPIVTEILKIGKEHTNTQASIVDKERTLQNLKEKAAKATEEEKNQVKAFYRPIEQGMDTEAIIAHEFAEILSIIRVNAIKTRSIKYEYDPKDDNFVKNVADKYNVAKLDIEMIAKYTDFERFLKELYKHEHFIDISNIEIVPYKKDKKILLIAFQIKLYAQK